MHIKRIHLCLYRLTRFDSEVRHRAFDKWIGREKNANDPVSGCGRSNCIDNVPMCNRFVVDFGPTGLRERRRRNTIFEFYFLPENPSSWRHALFLRITETAAVPRGTKLFILAAIIPEISSDRSATSGSRILRGEITISKSRAAEIGVFPALIETSRCHRCLRGTSFDSRREIMLKVHSLPSAR